MAKAAVGILGSGVGPREARERGYHPLTVGTYLAAFAAVQVAWLAGLGYLVWLVAGAI